MLLEMCKYMRTLVTRHMVFSHLVERSVQSWCFNAISSIVVSDAEMIEALGMDPDDNNN